MPRKRTADGPPVVRDGRGKRPWRTTDWSAEARRAVERIGTELHEAWCGAVLWKPGIIALFGNEGSKGRVLSRWLKGLREIVVQQLGAIELGFAASEDGYSWVILARPK